MNKAKHIIIYSHGFGVRKDGLGLFTDIAEALTDVESVLFDYYEVKDNLMYICPLSIQAEKLNQVVVDIRNNNPEAVIDLIGHSRGTSVAALAKPDGIRKAILISPVFDTDAARSIARYKTEPGAIIDLDGLSSIPSSTGITKLIPREYWQERNRVQPFVEYNEFAKKTEIIFIEAGQDELVPEVDLSPLDSKIKVISLDGDHNFSGEDRGKLIKLIKELL